MYTEGKRLRKYRLGARFVVDDDTRTFWYVEPCDSLLWDEGGGREHKPRTNRQGKRREGTRRKQKRPRRRGGRGAPKSTTKNWGGRGRREIRGKPRGWREGREDGEDGEDDRKNTATARGEDVRQKCIELVTKHNASMKDNVRTDLV